MKNRILPQINKGALSADGWTSAAGDNYFGLFFHFIDKFSGKPKKILLSALPKDNQDADSLVSRTKEVLQKWSIPLQKICYFTTDTTAVMPAMVRKLGVLWVPCLAHVMNLVVKNGLSDAGIESILKTHRKIVKQYRQSGLFRNGLKEAGFSKVLLPDVPTRWNSVYMMVERNLQAKYCITQKLPVISEGEEPPSMNEGKKAWKRRMTEQQWTTSSTLLALLKPILLITKCLEENELPTFSLTLPLCWSLFRHLKTFSSSNDPIIQKVASSMKDSLEKRVDNILGESMHNNYWAATFFDPRTRDLYRPF